MKIQTKTALNSLLISTLAMSSVVLAETQHKSSQSKIVKPEHAEAITTSKDTTVQHQTVLQKKSPSDYLKNINKEAREALKKVFEARQMIPQGQEREAIDALKEASKKFNEVLIAEPDLKKAAITSDMQFAQTNDSLKLIRSKISMAEKLLNQGKVQDARAILLPLVDEAVIQTTYLPMGTYPKTIKLAIKKLLDADKPGAIKTLDTGFGTIVKEQAVIPLSLLRAEAMITAASELDRKKDKKDVLELLKSASEQLQLATLLGYTNKASDIYFDLSTQIEALKKEVTADNVVERLYDKLKTSMEKLIKHHLDKTTKAELNKAKK